MKKLILFLTLFAFTMSSIGTQAQLINDAANFGPTTTWTVTGAYTALGFTSDPTVNTTFAFSDDDAGNGTTDNIAAESPVIDLSSAFGSENLITVDAPSYSYRALGGSTFNLEYWDADGSTWIVWESIVDNYVGGDGNLCDAGTYTSPELDISSFTATQQSGFRYRFAYDDAAGWQWGFCMGSPTITSAAPPTCLEPTGQSVSGITTTSADLAWVTGGATAWEIEYGPAGFTLGAGIILSGAALTNPYTLTGLTAGTFYDWYVRDDCGGGLGLSTQAGPNTFNTTLSGPVGVTCAMPGAPYVTFSEEFDDNSAGWTGDINGGNGTWEIPDDVGSANTGADAAHSGASYMNFEASNTVTNQGSIVSPQIYLGNAATAAELSFWMHAYGLSMGTLEIGVGTSPTGPFTTEFTWIGQFQTAGSDPWVNIGVDLTSYIGSTIYIQLTQIDDNNGVGSGFDGDMSIDLFEVTTCSGCALPPSALTTTAISSMDADIAWTGGEDLGGTFITDIEYGPAGFTLGSGISTTVSTVLPATPMFNIPGLTPGTDYEWYASSLCSNGEYSVNVGPVAFTTLPSCFEPTLQTVSSITASGAELAWTTGGAAAWEIEYGPTGFTQGTGTFVDNLTATNPFTLTGLSSDTEYDWYVRDYCGPGDVSAWSPVVTFLTLESCFVPTALASSITSTTADLTWTTGGATAWEIEYGPAGFTQGTGTIVDNMTATNPFTLTGLTSETSYDWYVRDYCGPGDVSVWSALGTFFTGYCLPVYAFGTPDGDLISEVEIVGTTLLNNTGTVAGLADYTYYNGGGTQTGDLQAGTSYDVNVTAGDFTGQNFSAWIDFNDDLVFDASENIGFTGAGAGTTIAQEQVTFTISLPCNPPVGIHRMRIRGAWNTDGGTIDPCANPGLGYGETEDYDVNVLAPPACPQISSLATFGTITDTSADFNWDIGCVETAWDYEVNTSPTPPAGAPANILHSDTFVNVTGLTASTTYYAHVRANCGGGNGESAWSTISFVTAATPPANDECISAVGLTVNPDYACGVVTAGTTTAATASAEADDVTGTPDNDVWYSFVATGTAHQVALTNLVAEVGFSTDMGMGIYDGTAGCGSLIFFADSDPETANLIGLTPGITYYVRVYGWGAGPGAEAAFDICVGTPPPPPANDECISATGLTVNADLLCGSTTPGTIASATASAEDAAACFGTENDDVWYSFVATATSHTVDLLNITGGTTDLYHSLWEGTCGTLTQIGTCSDPNNSIQAGLTIGNTYYLRVYSWTGTPGQTSSFDVCIGTQPPPPPPPANDDLCNAQLLVVDDAPFDDDNTNSTGQTSEPFGACWLASGGDVENSVWYSFVATADTLKVSTDFAGTGLTDGHISLFNSPTDCNDLTTLGAEIGCSEDDGVLGAGFHSIINAGSLTIGNTYYVQFDGWGANVGDYKIQVTTYPTPGTFVWNGSTDNVWTNTANWADGVVPTGCGTQVFIQSGGFAPTITALDTVGDLTTQAGATINVVGPVLTAALSVCNTMELGAGTTINGNVAFYGADINITGTAYIGGLGTYFPTTLISGNLEIGDGLGLVSTFTNNGTVTLKSTAASTAFLNDFTSPTASFIGNITVERFITPGVGLGQRFFGSAVSGSSATGLDMTYASGYPTGAYVTPDVCNVSLASGSAYSNLFQFEQANVNTGDCDQNGWFAMNPSAMLMPVRGYSAWVNDGSVISVTGAPNTVSSSFGTSGANGSGVVTADGWHLLSNPFPSSLNVAAFINDGFTSPSIYDGGSGAFNGTFHSALNYVAAPGNGSSGGSNGVLASMQGFFAENTSGDAIATVTNSDRIADNTTTWYSTSNVFDQMLTINVFGNGFGDRTHIFYADNTLVTTGFDGHTDSKKRSSNEGQPTIYSSLNNDMMALNGFPTSEMGTSIPFGVDHGADGNFELTFEGLANFAANTTVYVEDKQAGVYHNVANGNYAYSALASDNSDRFELHFVLPVDLATVNANCAGDAGKIELVSTLGLTNRDFVVTDVNTTVASGALNTLDVNVAEGTYTVTVNDEFGGNQEYTVTVEADEAIEALYDVSSLDVQVGELVSFNNLTTNATSVEWNIANITSINGVDNATYTFDEVGSYEIMLNVSTNECSDMKAFTVNVSNKTTSVTTLAEDNSLKVYSNNNTVVLEFLNSFEGNAIVEIQNILGQKVFTGTVDATGTQTISIKDVTTGYYFVGVNVDGKSISSKLLLTKE